MRVLVIDTRLTAPLKEGAVRVGDLCREAGYEVEEVVSYGAALRLANQSSFGIVIMDGRVPDGNPHSAAAFFREKNKAVYVALVVDHVFDDLDRAVFAQVGITAVISRGEALDGLPRFLREVSSSGSRMAA